MNDDEIPARKVVYLVLRYVTLCYFGLGFVMFAALFYFSVRPHKLVIGPCGPGPMPAQLPHKH